MKERGLTLAPIFCDGMILQREEYNRIYGTETEEDTITVSFMGTQYRVRVDDNFEFSVEIPPTAAGGPYSLTIEGSSIITIRDILFGDVFLLSGQSNMELPVRRVLDVSEEEISHTCEPEIRQYLVPASYNFSESERYMYASSWKKAEGEDLMGFSAVGFFFAKEIKNTYQVPVGLLQTAVGGSSIEAWMSPASLRRFGNYHETIEKFQDKNYFNQYIQSQQDLANEWAYRVEQEEQRFSDNEDIGAWDTCIVPSLVSDYTSDPFYGSVYLCREISLASEPKDEDAYIYMGSIIDSDQVWINGILTGRTDYRFPPRKYRIPHGILRAGRNRITVRIVINNGNGGTVKRKPYYLYCEGSRNNLEGEWYYRIGKRAEKPMPSALFPPSLPVCFYHTVVVPFSRITVRGILWYQGEANAFQPEHYAEKFSTMVSDWRNLYGYEVPFIYVQLANYREPLVSGEDTGWAELREQQRQNLSLYNVAMVAAMDLGEENDVHPQNKKEVGVRMANAAKYLIYNEAQPYSSPLPKSANVIGRNAEIFFRYLEDTEAECTLNNFELAGEDKIFYPATAIRKGKCVTVFSEKVEIPVYVRYAWRDNPNNINFYNSQGLPAVGFRLELPNV